MNESSHHHWRRRAVIAVIDKSVRNFAARAPHGHAIHIGTDIDMYLSCIHVYPTSLIFSFFM
jgi:hypothetical protein